jgi:hypothetical protein
MIPGLYYLSLVQKLWNILQFDDTIRQPGDINNLPLVFNYQLKGGSSPKPQVYLPLHGRNDQLNADRLTEFFQFLDWKGVFWNYNQELDSLLSVFSPFL